MKNITVIAAGQMASALAFPACLNGHAVRLVGSVIDGEIIEHGKKTHRHKTLLSRTSKGIEEFTMPDGVRFYDWQELDGLIADTDVFVCGVSSFGLDWFVQSVIPLLPDNIPVLSVTKGLYERNGELLTYPEVMEDRARELKKSIPFYAIGGPCTSYELAYGDQSHVVFCGRDTEGLEKLRSIFETPYYRIGISTDVRGVESAVALKNAYALAVSLAIGASYKKEGAKFEHYNSEAAIFTQASREMERLLIHTAGSADQLHLGIGDLYVTVFGGRTRRMGTLLGMGYRASEAIAELDGVTLESTVITKRMGRFALHGGRDGTLDTSSLPLLMHIYKLLEEDTVSDIPYGEFR